MGCIKEIGNIPGIYGFVDGSSAINSDRDITSRLFPYSEALKLIDAEEPK